MDDEQFTTLQNIYDLWMFVMPCVTELDDYYNFTRAASGIRLRNFVDSIEVKAAKQKIIDKKRMDEATGLFRQIVNEAQQYWDTHLQPPIINDDRTKRCSELTGFSFMIHGIHQHLMYSASYRDNTTGAMVLNIETGTSLIGHPDSIFTFVTDSKGRVVLHEMSANGREYIYYVNDSEALMGPST